MKFENTEVFNIKGALRGMRNPLESWDKSDSTNDNSNGFVIGEKDLKLAQSLIKARPEHRKFLRQITTCVDITAPIYWWKEFDTYKVGTTANSTSTMHRLLSTPITMECFEMEDYEPNLLVYDRQPYNLDNLMCDIWEEMICHLETLRKRAIEYANASKREDITCSERKHFVSVSKYYWKELIRLLPESWLQKRTVTVNYENILNMCDQREGHKLSEWHKFIEWAKSLPYAENLLFINRESDQI